MTTICSNGEVLIESDWNLKCTGCRKTPESRNPVLIESDWNLKECVGYGHMGGVASINRIRLEFKVESNISPSGSFPCINRIRLEFKVEGSVNSAKASWVLIESDWNLKQERH